MLKKIIILVLIAGAVLVGAVYKYSPSNTFEEAIVLYNEGDYLAARAIFNDHVGFPKFNHDAEYYIGKMIYMGEGTIPDKYEGQLRLISAADNGSKNAIYHLAFGQKDNNKYRDNKDKYLEILAAEGFVDAQIEMLLDPDRGNSQSQFKSLEAHLISSFDENINRKSNYSDILAIDYWNDLSNLYSNRKSQLRSDESRRNHINKLYKIALKKANDGNPYWQSVLANSTNLWDIEDKESFSLKWTKEAANNGYLGSLVSAARQYKDIDHEQALIWLQKAVERKSGNAYYYLGDIYSQHQSVEPDFELAYEYFNRAYALGVTPAIEKASEIAFSEKLNNIDLKSVKDMLIYAASIDSGKFSNLIKVYEDYDVVAPISPNVKVAIEKGVAENKLGALLASALMYKHGDGVIQDESKTLEYYLKAWEGYIFRRSEFSHEVFAFINEDPTRLDVILSKIDKESEKKNEDLKELVGLAYLFKEGFELDVTYKSHYGKYVYDAVYKKSGTQASMVAHLFKDKEIDGTENLEQAFKWDLMAAQLGHKDDFFTVGYAYGEGEGVQKDIEKSIYWYEKAAENGSSVAMYNIGLTLKYDINTPESKSKAIGWYLKAVEHDYPKAMYQLGQAYKLGEGVKKDLKQAFQWYKKASEKDDDSAYIQLAYAYDKGRGTKEDNKLALKWYEKSADAGRSGAMRNIGYMYRDGDGVNKNSAKAFDWFLKAAREGDVSSMYQVGLNYYNGSGVSVNLEKAVYWYEKELENNGYSSYTNLGYMYSNGKGVKQDKWKAISLYKKGVENKSAVSASNLGWAYVNGDPVYKNFTEAKKYFDLAVKYGGTAANDGLGYLYEFGNGVNKNRNLAIQYYRKAGTDFAKKRLEALGV